MAVTKECTTDGLWNAYDFSSIILNEHNTRDSIIKCMSNVINISTNTIYSQKYLVETPVVEFDLVITVIMVYP